MANKIFRQESILDGISPTLFFGSTDSYSSSLGIDPDLPTNFTQVRTSGALVPSSYAKFSGTEFTGVPKWIITQPKTSNSFVYASDGKFHSFSSLIAMRTTDEAGTSFPIQITGGEGNGAAYYNNFIYLFEDSNISQYGGMDQGASIAKTENVWTGAKFSKATLTNFVYPTIRGGDIPNHPAHVHVDNALYFGDTLNGQGIIHKIKTKMVTIQGDTDDGSAFNVLDLPFGFYPTDIESYGTDLVIAAIQPSTSTNGAVVNQGRAALFFWDTISDSFYRQVLLPDPLVTALLNVNGVLHVFSGNAVSGARISKYVGGESIQQIAFFEEGVSPFAGAVDAFGERITFGLYTTYPEASASVGSVGSKQTGLPDALHNIIRTSSTGTNPATTCLKYVQQANNAAPRVIVGWSDGSGIGLDKYQESDGGFTLASVWRSKVFVTEDKFKMNRIKFTVSDPIASGIVITPKVYVDGGSSSFTLTAVNNTNFSGKRTIVFKRPAVASVTGFHDFFLELKWTGTSMASVLFPIIFEVEIFADET